MAKVAKLVMIDTDDNYLLLYRSDHPLFGTDPDLPGGTLETGESTLETMIREVEEEAGVTILPDDATELCASTNYSSQGVLYVLYSTVVEERPKIVLSWEHSSYEWVGLDEFLERAKLANDTYMHMVHDYFDGISRGNSSHREKKYLTE